MPITLNCKTCNSKFRVKSSRVKKGAKFCSCKCNYISQKGKITPIHVKEKLRIAAIKAGCMPPHHIGEKSSHWKGGITPLYMKIRNCPKYNQWRIKVWQRDYFTCLFCKKKGVKLHADHIKPFSIIIKEEEIKTLKDALENKVLWNIKNGRTLCIPCHKETDTYLNKAKNYKSNE